MSEDICTLSSHNIWDAIDLLNRSSRDSSLRYDLDIFGFGRLSRYWNISHEYSLIRYVAGKPAALILNCVDREARDAYTFYWGVLPEFRTSRIGLALVEAACRKLHENGYVMHYAVAVPDRPARRYRFVKFQPGSTFVDMEAQSINLPAPDARFEVRELTAEQLPALLDLSHWCQRHTFLQRASGYLNIFGAFEGDLLKSYAVRILHSIHTTLSDIRVTDSSPSAALHLVRWLTVQENFQRPLTVNYVLENSAMHSLLTSLGFAVKRRFSLLSRDLRAMIAPATASAI